MLLGGGLAVGLGGRGLGLIRPVVVFVAVVLLLLDGQGQVVITHGCNLVVGRLGSVAAAVATVPAALRSHPSFLVTFPQASWVTMHRPTSDLPELRANNRAVGREEARSFGGASAA